MRSRSRCIKSFKLVCLGLSAICVSLCMTTFSCFAVDNTETLDNTTSQNIKELQRIESNITSQEREEFSELKQSEKDSRMIMISKSYTPGETLTEQDAEFVLLYLHNNISTENSESSGVIKTATNTRTNGSGACIVKTAYGAQVAFFPQFWVTHVNATTMSYKANMSLDVLSGKVKKVSMRTHHTAYGIVGGKGMVVTYSGSIGDTFTTSKTHYSTSKSKSYSGLWVTYTFTYASADVTTSKGSFTVDSHKYNWVW